MPVIIALTGYDRCGKDTTADKIISILSKNGYRVGRRALADSLKKIASRMLNIDLCLLEKMKNDNILVGFGYKYITVRDILIRLSSALKEVIGEDIFVKRTLESIIKEDLDVFIVTDLRFKIEDDVFRKSIIPYLLIKIESDIDTCGNNGKKYEIDELKPDLTFFNKSGHHVDNMERLEKICNYIISNYLESDSR